MRDFATAKNFAILFLYCRGSSVVERYPEEVGVVSSILTRGTNFEYMI